MGLREGIHSHVIHNHGTTSRMSLSRGFHPREMPEAQRRQASFEDLPTDVFREVLYLYTPDEILDLCQRANDPGVRVCFDERFWRFKTLFDFPHSEEEYQSIAKDVSLSWKQFYRAKARKRKILPVYSQGTAITFITVAQQTKVVSALSRIRNRVLTMSPKELQQRRNIVLVAQGEKTPLGALGATPASDILSIKISLQTTFAEKPFKDAEYFVLS